jgi:hypothetical protein
LSGRCTSDIPSTGSGVAEKSAKAMVERAIRASSVHRGRAARKCRSCSKPPKIIGLSAREQHSSSMAHDNAISVLFFSLCGCRAG